MIVRRQHFAFLIFPSVPANEKILTHDLISSEAPVQIRRIAHKNHYDFSKLHRHNYFEILFFRKGGGENLIDFQKYEVKDNACHISYPGQTHLLHRHPGSAGLLIQFQLESILSRSLERLLQERAWSGIGAVVFEENKEAMSGIVTLLEAMQTCSESRSVYWKECQKSLLQALLFKLCAFGTGNQQEPLDTDFYHFQQLVDQYFRTSQTVGFYLDKLPFGEKRLAALSKTHSGISPLQVIHRRILLEAKRLLLLGEKAHKEIAFDLGFDSPASFSAFIKKKTGLTASEIQAQVAEIHK